ncbi:MAG: NAD(P)/FAD-dependent oxidoreductase [Coriobacteriia bacterium]
MRQSDVLIIGGGAAGLTAAIAAARLGASVALLEAGARVGRKILESGNGRCNLTNVSVVPEAYNHPEFVEQLLGTYSSDAIRAFFAGIGLLTRADDEGRVYPTTNAAASVLEVLRLECDHVGVDVRCEFEVAGVSEAPGGGFTVTSATGETLHASAVVVATGGGASVLTGFGHDSVGRVPVLGPIKTDIAPIRGLSGVRVRCEASLLAGEAAAAGWGAAAGDARDSAPGESPADVGGSRAVLATECGELLFRDYGVSGIMVFDLSRYLEKDCTLSIDFFPDMSAEDLQTALSDRCESLSWRSAGTLLVGMLHDRVARAVLRAADIEPSTPAGKVPDSRLAALLKDFRVSVLGMADARQAQVTRGGADVAQFDPGTLASRCVSGLFAAGEVLDVDGRSGGFNLHWAWASGIVAGESAARFAAEHAAEKRVTAPGDPA